jgi:hypothetical protein
VGREGGQNAASLCDETVSGAGFFRHARFSKKTEMGRKKL